jgi:hypothetical protein
MVSLVTPLTTLTEELISLGDASAILMEVLAGVFGGDEDLACGFVDV